MMIAGIAAVAVYLVLLVPAAIDTVRHFDDGKPGILPKWLSILVMLPWFALAGVWIGVWMVVVEMFERKK